MRAARMVGRGRRLAEGLMADACLIERETGQVLDEDTGQYVAQWSAVYAGKCRVQDTGLSGRTVAAGERPVELLRRVLQVPMSAPAAQVDDRVTITTSQLDPQLAGRQFRVADLFHATHKTARRLPIEEITS